VDDESQDGSSRRDFLKYSGAFGGLVAASGFLAACGDDDDDDDAATTDTTAAGSETTAAGTETTAAGTDTTAAGGTGVTSGVIGLTLNGLNEYTKGVATGVYKALEGTDFELQVVQGNYDAAEELAAAESFVAQGVVGLVIQPNTTESAGAAAQTAFEQGIPAGNCIWPGPSDADQYFVGVAELDSVEGGRLIGEWLIENTEPGQIVVVQGVVGQGFSERIDEGLDAALEGTDYEVVVREQGFFDRVEAVTIVETAFQAHPDISIIVAYSASMSNGIAQWLQDNEKEGITHVSSDADEEMVGWMATPYLQATRYYSSAQTGLIAGSAVVTALAGGTPEFRTVIDQVIATSDTIEQIAADNPYMFFEYQDRVQDI
jgi:ABC-type sugar transport system substrate-binding protein